MAAAATATATASPIRRPPRNVRMIYLSPMSGMGSARGTRLSRLQCRLLPHNNLGADRHAIIEVGDVGVDQPETPGRDRGTDCIGPVGAMDAVDGSAKIHRASAERVAGTTGHEAWQIGLARDHLRWRGPVRPFRLAGDIQQSLPLKSIAADADAITQRPAVALDQIE